MKTMLRSLPAAVVLAALIAGGAPARPAFAADPPSKTAPAAKEKLPPKRIKKPKYLPPPTFERTESDVIRSHVNWRWHLLTYPATTIPPAAMTRAAEHVERFVPQGEPWKGAGEGLRHLDPRAKAVAPVDDGGWTMLGPRPINMATQRSGYKYGKVNGRFNAVAVDPRTVNNAAGQIRVLAAAASGGLWLSTNCCTTSTTWTSVLERAPVQAFSAIEFDPNNPDIVYAGSGDADASDQFSEGLFKSLDAGLTWTQLGADVFTPYAAGTPRLPDQNIGWIEVNPRDSNTLLVGTNWDLFVSNDAGQTYQRCPFGANPLNPVSPVSGQAYNRISSILLDPSTAPTTVYVAVGTPYGQNGDNGVYKGTIPAQGCPTLTLKANSWPSGTGTGVNGASDVGVVRLAASSSDGTFTLYAQVSSRAGSNALGTWVTRDGAETWKLLSGTSDVKYIDCNRTPNDEAQDWYDLFAMADPFDNRKLYVGRVDLYKIMVDTTYSSATILALGNVYTPGCTGYGKLHPDQHGGTWIKGTGSGTSSFLVAGDGGLYLGNGAAGGFTQLNGSINAIQWYAGQLGRNFAGGTQYLFAGAQDNGTASWDSTQASAEWQARSNGGDGFYSVFDPIGGTLNAGVWLAEYTNGRMYRSTAGADGSFDGVGGAWEGDRAAWSTPIELDAFHCTTANCNNVVVGAARVYASSDAGATWTRTGTADLTKGSGSVIALETALSSPSAVVAGTSDGKVQVAMDVFTGPNCTQAAANTAAFACTVNQNATWTDLTGGNTVLPNRAINGVGFDPTTTDRVYAAVGGFNANTIVDGHVFQATYANGTWTWIDKTGNLPDVPAEAIVINPNNPNQAFVGTDFGFYYTNDIMANPPTWSRHEIGLPSTIIKYLTVDRGPEASPYASTTLAAFTYGRGTYAIRLPGSSGFPPHAVRETMTARRDGTGVRITYENACANTDHNVYWGALGSRVASGASCSVGATGTATANVPNNSWFLVTGADAQHGTVSAFGRDSSGGARLLTGWTTLCAQATQNTNLTCP